MKKRIVLWMVACMLLPLAACASGAPPGDAADGAEPGGFAFNADNLPEIDGSTATIPLIGAVYSVLLGVQRAEADAMVHTSGTDNAYRRLIDREVNLLLVYAPAEDSLAYAQAMGVELTMAPIGRDALVFLVNRENAVQDLTHAQLVDIYSGRLTNWKDAGGEDVAIRAFQRPLVSGSQTMMNKLVMQGTEMAPAEPAYIIGEMGGLVDAVAAYDNSGSAIGYNVYYYVSRMKLDENVRLLSVGGVAPSKEAISSGDYPFVNDFYAVIRSEAATDSPERLLFDWIQSPDGQTLVDSEGYAAAAK